MYAPGCWMSSTTRGLVRQLAGPRGQQSAARSRSRQVASAKQTRRGRFPLTAPRLFLFATRWHPAFAGCEHAERKPRFRSSVGWSVASTSSKRSASSKSSARELFGVSAPQHQLGRFTILDRVGAGAMGVVYAAYDPQLDRKVAIKVLHPTDEPDEQGNARLVREARALAKVDHPSVVTVHEVGTYAERVFVAMEFVEGRTLTSWLAEGRSPEELLPLFLAAGRGARCGARGRARSPRLQARQRPRRRSGTPTGVPCASSTSDWCASGARRWVATSETTEDDVQRAHDDGARWWARRRIWPRSSTAARRRRPPAISSRFASPCSRPSAGEGPSPRPRARGCSWRSSPARSRFRRTEHRAFPRAFARGSSAASSRILPSDGPTWRRCSPSSIARRVGGGGPPSGWRSSAPRWRPARTSARRNPILAKCRGRRSRTPTTRRRPRRS